MVSSLKGHLLIADGQLFDPNFRQTVVLVCEHGEAGAIGVVLNRPSGIAVAEAAPSLASVASGERLFVGGPVHPEAALLLAEFERPELADNLVVGPIGLLSGDVESRLAGGARRVRVFAGHAGWGPGQLENELAGASWIVEPAVPDDVLSDRADQLWRTVLKRKGGRHALLASMPFDPSVN